MNKIISIPDTPGTYWFRDHAKDGWKLVFVEAGISLGFDNELVNVFYYTILVKDNNIYELSDPNYYMHLNGKCYNAEWIKIELPSVDETKSDWEKVCESITKTGQAVLSDAMKILNEYDKHNGPEAGPGDLT